MNEIKSIANSVARIANAIGTSSQMELPEDLTLLDRMLQDIADVLENQKPTQETGFWYAHIEGRRSGKVYWTNYRWIMDGHPLDWIRKQDDFAEIILRFYAPCQDPRLGPENKKPNILQRL